MTTEEIQKLTDAGVELSVIEGANGGDLSTEVATLTASLTAEQGKSATFLTEKKELKTQLTAKETELNEIEVSKLGKDEQAEARRLAMQQQIDDAKAETARIQKEVADAERGRGVLQIGAGIQFTEDVKPELREFIVQNALKDIDDLTADNPLVVKAVDGINTAYAGLIKSGLANGDGGKDDQDKGGGGSGDSQPQTMKEIMGETGWETS